jgi:hypothetical protein
MPICRLANALGRSAELEVKSQRRDLVQQPVNLGAKKGAFGGFFCLGMDQFYSLAMRGPTLSPEETLVNSRGLSPVKTLAYRDQETDARIAIRFAKT